MAGLSDTSTRSGMLWEVERLLNELNETNSLPQVLLMENVKNLLSRKFKPDFDRWLIKLEQLGYKNFYKVLNAKDYGVPQNRERVFCVSILDESAKYEFPEPFELKLKLKDLLEDDVDEKYYLSEKMIKYISADNEKWTGNNDKALINKDIASTINTGEGSRRCDASNYISKDLPENYDLKSMFTETQAKMFTKDGDVKRYINSNKIDKFGEGQCADISFPNGYNKGPRVHDECPALNTTTTQSSFCVKVREATKKGYKEAYEGDSVNLEQPNSETRRGRVGNQVAQTLTTSCNQGVVVKDKCGNEFVIKDTKQLRETIEQNELQDGSSLDLYNRTVHNDGVSQTLDTGIHNSQRVVTSNDYQLRIRKLTCKECFRLMGVRDENFEKVAANQSNTSLYHLAGDSIVVDVLRYIFKEFLEGEKDD